MQKPLPAQLPFQTVTVDVEGLPAVQLQDEFGRKLATLGCFDHPADQKVLEDELSRFAGHLNKKLPAARENYDRTHQEADDGANS